MNQLDKAVYNFEGSVLNSKFKFLDKCEKEESSKVYRGTVLNDFPIHEGKEVQLIAIKVIYHNQFTNTKQQQQLEEEIGKQYELESEHIVKLFECYRDQRCIFLIYEYCDGGCIETYFKKHNMKNIPERKIKDYFLQILQGLQVLHSQKILHCNIKQSSILFKGNKIKLSGIGASNQTKYDKLLQNRTPTEAEMNIAPELFDNQKYGLEAELYSLGILFYQIVMKKYPFQRIPQSQSDSQNIKFQGVSPQLEDLIKNMLRYRPQDRIKFQEIMKHDFFKYDEDDSQFINSSHVFDKNAQQKQNQHIKSYEKNDILPISFYENEESKNNDIDKFQIGSGVFYVKKENELNQNIKENQVKKVQQSGQPQNTQQNYFTPSNQLNLQGNSKQTANQQNNFNQQDINPKNNTLYQQINQIEYKSQQFQTYRDRLYSNPDIQDEDSLLENNNQMIQQQLQQDKSQYNQFQQKQIFQKEIQNQYGMNQNIQYSQEVNYFNNNQNQSGQYILQNEKTNNLKKQLSDQNSLNSLSTKPSTKVNSLEIGDYKQNSNQLNQNLNKLINNNYSNQNQNIFQNQNSYIKQQNEIQNNQQQNQNNYSMQNFQQQQQKQPFENYQQQQIQQQQQQQYYYQKQQQQSQLQQQLKLEQQKQQNIVYIDQKNCIQKANDEQIYQGQLQLQNNLKKMDDCAKKIKQVEDEQEAYLFLFFAIKNLYSLNQYCQDKKLRFQTYIGATLFILNKKCLKLNEAIINKLQSQEYTIVEQNQPQKYKEILKKVESDQADILSISFVAGEEYDKIKKSISPVFVEFIKNYASENSRNFDASYKNQLRTILIDTLLDLSCETKIPNVEDCELKKLIKDSCIYLTLAIHADEEDYIKNMEYKLKIDYKTVVKHDLKTLIQQMDESICTYEVDQDRYERNLKMQQFSLSMGGELQQYEVPQIRIPLKSQFQERLQRIQ